MRDIKASILASDTNHVNAKLAQYILTALPLNSKVMVNIETVTKGFEEYFVNGEPEYNPFGKEWFVPIKNKLENSSCYRWTSWSNIYLSKVNDKSEGLTLASS